MPSSRTPTSTRRRGRCSSRCAERVTWDAPLHSLADIEAMPWSPPKTINSKPSRFGPISGPLRRLRLLRRARDRRLRRRSGRARAGPRADPVPGLDLPSGHAERHRARRLQRSRRPLRPAGAADGAGFRSAARLPLGLSDAALRRTELGVSATFALATSSRSKEPQMAEKSFADALNEQIANEFAASPAVRRDRRLLRRRDAAPPGRLLLPPGARGARARDDDDPLPARCRRGGPDPRTSSRTRRTYADGFAPVKMALEQEKRVSGEIFSLFESPAS